MDFAEWRKKARHVVTLTLIARDVDGPSVEFIVVIDNGDWDDLLWTHWCLGPDLCEANCGGSEEQAADMMVIAAKLSVGQPAPTPFRYRWKGVEQFVAKLYRARRQHDPWIQTHEQLFPKHKVDRAENELALMGGEERSPDNNAVIRVKQQIRGERQSRCSRTTHLV